MPTLKETVVLPIRGISQFASDHPDQNRICSPTSLYAILRFLIDSSVSFLNFTSHVLDDAFDIYGNWVLNCAEGSHLLGEDWIVYATRVDHFDEVIQLLLKGYPVIVSVKGVLLGAERHYDQGHLMVIRGYESSKRQVLCMDPAFQSDENTLAEYPLEEFLEAWAVRKGLAYILKRLNDVDSITF